jgi:hypothetical protein
MGTPVYVLVKTVTGTGFVACAKDIPGVRYVASAVGAYRGVVVLDLARLSEIDGVLHKLEACGAVPTMETLRPTGPSQLKFAQPDHDAFMAVKVASLPDVGPVRRDIKAVAGVADAAVVASDTTDILVEIQGPTDRQLHAAIGKVLQAVGNRGTSRTSVVANRDWKGPPAGRTPG